MPFIGGKKKKKTFEWKIKLSLTCGNKTNHFVPNQRTKECFSSVGVSVAVQ